MASDSGSLTLHSLMTSGFWELGLLLELLEPVDEADFLSPSEGDSLWLILSVRERILSVWCLVCRAYQPVAPKTPTTIITSKISIRPKPDCLFIELAVWFMDFI